MHGSSSGPPMPTVAEEDNEFPYGAESGWVDARTSCDHLPTLSSDLAHIPPPGTHCTRCDHTVENWLCLTCKDVLCSRFVNKHMLNHYHESGHCLSLSYSDLSVWCFSCDAYLDAQGSVGTESINLISPWHPRYLQKFVGKCTQPLRNLATNS